MIGLSRSACHRHREALLSFADHRDASAVDEASMEHLDRCPGCRHDVEAVALAVIGLRRLGAEASTAEPPADAWPRLRTRVSEAPARWRWRAPLGGLLVSAALVAIVLAPVAWLRPPAPYLEEAGVATSIAGAQRAAEDRGEAQVLRLQVAARARPVVVDPEPPAVVVDATWFGPDGLRRRAIEIPAGSPSRHV